MNGFDMIAPYIDREFLTVADKCSFVLLLITLPVRVQQINCTTILTVPNRKTNRRCRLDPTFRKLFTGRCRCQLTHRSFILASQGSLRRIDRLREIDDLTRSERDYSFCRQRFIVITQHFTNNGVIYREFHRLVRLKFCIQMSSSQNKRATSKYIVTDTEEIALLKTVPTQEDHCLIFIHHILRSFDRQNIYCSIRRRSKPTFRTATVDDIIRIKDIQ